jgi:hypothetical protein
MGMTRLPAILLCLALPAFPQGKADPEARLSDEDKIELIRGLTAELVTVKAFVPRSKKALKFNSDGTWEESDWKEAGLEYGPVARVGEMVKITRIDFDKDKIILEINSGLNLKGKWYERLEGAWGGATGRCRYPAASRGRPEPQWRSSSLHGFRRSSRPR